MFGWDFSYSIGKIRFSVSLLDRIFQLVSKQVEKSILRLCHMIVVRVGTRTISRSCSDSTENDWKSVLILLRNVTRINPNWLRLKRLIQTEHDLNMPLFSVHVYFLSLPKGKLRSCQKQNSGFGGTACG